MIRNSREANVFLRFHRDILSETNSNRQNDLKWDKITLLIIALSCHYFEKMESSKSLVCMTTIFWQQAHQMSATC